MPNPDQIDKYFALLEDEDVDFVGAQAYSDVPVLTYRWSQNDVVERAPLSKLIEVGKQVMEDLGLRRTICKGHHLRGDSEDQRVKMTVLRSGGRSMYILMAAGMPGTREKSKRLNRQIAQRLEERLRGAGRPNESESPPG